nr:MAG TPA: hypothetical protein [Caudoviricetes sp.]
MLSLWACFNGLSVAGLLFAAINGIKTDNKDLIKQVYGGNQHIAVWEEEDTLSDEEKEYVKGRVKDIMDEKMHYIIGFLMSAVGAIGVLCGNYNPPAGMACQRGEIIVSIIIWFLVAYGLKYVTMKVKVKKIITEIEKNPELLVSVGDVKMVIRKTKERKN